MKTKKYTVVDLFAGAGGLSLGFQQTGFFNIIASFENNLDAQKTYINNHPNVELYDDIRKVDFKCFKNKYSDIDVVIGGPPCQGFSNANRQKNHAVNQNNMLLKQYIKAVIELQPKAFVMENVSMLKSEVHRFLMESNDVPIVNKYNIPLGHSELVLLDEKHKFKEAIDIVKDINHIQSRLWDAADYQLLNVVYKQCNNSRKLISALTRHEIKLKKIAERFNGERLRDYIFDYNRKVALAILKFYNHEISASDLTHEIEQPIMIQRMLGKAKEILDNNLVVHDYKTEKGIVASINSFTVFDYLNNVLGAEANGYVIDSGILCAADFGVPQKRMRFVVIGVKKSISKSIELPKGFVNPDKYTTVWDAIADISNECPVHDTYEDEGLLLDEPRTISDLTSKLRDSKILYNHIVTRTGIVAYERFSTLQPGQNFHDLVSHLKENTYTDTNRTQNTVYLRLNYNEPSGTVVNVRKSMWIHPEYNRAISVREAARLQTFPDSYIFSGSKDSQYQQVGNAVPPFMAKHIALKIAETLSHDK